MKSLPPLLTQALRNAPEVELPCRELGLELNSWTLDEATLQFLASLAEAMRPRSIIEFGGGVSTQILAWATAKKNTECHLLSFDHDPAFLASTLEALQKQGQKCAVTCRLAPLILRSVAGAWLPKYELRFDYFHDIQAADLIVIDGPPAALGGREGMIFQAMELAKPGTIVILDDANRCAERIALARWEQMLEGAIDLHLLPGFSKGLAAITIREPISTVEVMDHVAELAAADFGRSVPAGANCILIDDSQYAADKLLPGYHFIPFLEKDGRFWGPPADDGAAIDELQRLQGAGCQFIAFAWLAGWWLEYYRGFLSHLRSQWPVHLDNGRWLIFDLRASSSFSSEHKATANQRRS